MVMDLTDLYERLKTVAGEILVTSSELAEYLENQYIGESSDEVKKYSEFMQISNVGLWEMLKEAQSVSANSTNALSFASKVDSYLTVTGLSAEKLSEANQVDPTATSLARDLSDKRVLAHECIKEIYSMTDAQTLAGTQNATRTMLQTQTNPLFWLVDSGASSDTLALSTNLLRGPLDNSEDQKTLANLTVPQLLKEWENGVAYVKGLAEEAEEGGIQNKISAAVSLLTYNRNQLRTLYNNLAITVQRLEQRSLV